MEVRQATRADVDAIAAIHVRSWQAAYRGILSDELLDGLSVSERAGAWHALLAGGEERWLTLVAEPTEGEIAGFCSVATPSHDTDAGETTAELAALYIDPGHWRKGAGTALLEVTVGRLRAGGFQDVVLWVLPENRAAIAFYAHFDFRIEAGVEKREERSGRPVIRLRAKLG
jgi:ribosomal protein S18 acetylase RimI-like enzyme